MPAPPPATPSVPLTPPPLPLLTPPASVSIPTWRTRPPVACSDPAAQLSASDKLRDLCISPVPANTPSLLSRCAPLPAGTTPQTSRTALASRPSHRDHRPPVG